MNGWYEREAKLLDQDYEDGLISASEYNEAMRQLNSELMMVADEAAEAARNDVLGWW